MVTEDGQRIYREGGDQNQDQDQQQDQNEDQENNEARDFANLCRFCGKVLGNKKIGIKEKEKVL